MLPEQVISNILAEYVASTAKVLTLLRIYPERKFEVRMELEKQRDALTEILTMTESGTERGMPMIRQDIKNILNYAQEQLK